MSFLGLFHWPRHHDGRSNRIDEFRDRNGRTLSMSTIERSREESLSFDEVARPEMK